MSRGRIHRLHGVAQAAGQRLAATQPWLRMVGLTYAGAGALAAVGLVVTASFTPVGRVVQQVAVPAQEAVTSATQSARGAIGGVFTVPGPRFFIPPRPPAVGLPETALEVAEPEPTEAAADTETQISQVQAIDAM